MLKLKSCKGFTLIEVVVVAGIIAILAGFLVPMIFNQVDDAKITRAQGDMKTIQTCIMSFKKDTGNWPNKTTDPNVTQTLIFSDPSASVTPPLPTLSANFDSSLTGNMASHLSVNQDNVYGTTWKGPYAATFSLDPWGKSYVINADKFASSTAPVWIVSGGPDLTIQTDVNTEICQDKNASPAGDDVCLRLK